MNGIIFWTGLWSVILILAIISIIAFFWALINILTAKNDTNWKILWVLLCLFLGIIGVIIYLCIGRKERKAPRK